MEMTEDRLEDRSTEFTQAAQQRQSRRMKEPPAN
jgi:hypothetical protein